MKMNMKGKDEKAITAQEDRITKMRRTLSELPPKTGHKTKREIVADMRSEIIAAHENGYGYDEIVEVLRADGLEIKESTLKSYLQINRHAAGEESKIKVSEMAGKTSKKRIIIRKRGKTPRGTMTLKSTGKTAANHRAI